MTIHPDDDMAHNILREQQRDAAPTKDEMAEAHRAFLEDRKCTECGETNSAMLRAVNPSELLPSCPAIRHPDRAEPTVYCDACWAERPSTTGEAIIKAKERNQRGPELRTEAVIIYQCGTYELVEAGAIDDGEGNRFSHPNMQATAPVQCRCGAWLSTLISQDDPEWDEWPRTGEVAEKGSLGGETAD